MIEKYYLVNNMHEECLFIQVRYNTAIPPVHVIPTLQTCRIVYYILLLAGLPGFARDSCSIIMSICAFHFYIIYFNFVLADHGIPQTFDEILTN